MSQRTKEIANKLLENQSPLDNIAKFLHDIKDHLQALKFQANNSIEHRGLINKEIPEFLRDVFPEIEDINGFLTLLGIFGLDWGHFFSDAYVFFDREKSGFIMVQQPSGQLNTFEKSQFCLMYQRAEDGNPILSITGINDKRILAAEYKFNPSENGYIRTRLDIGVEENELRGYSPLNLNLRYFSKETKSPLITERMLKKVPLHNWILGLRDQPIPNIVSLTKFRNIPQKIAINT